MKQRVSQKILFLLLCSFLATKTASAQTLLDWDGGGDGVSWNDANNWNPNNVPNTTSEYAQFNGITVSVSLPVGGISTGGLVIIGTGTVTLSASAVEALRLNATALGFELDIASTAELILLNADLELGASSAARINGTLNANARQISAVGVGVSIEIAGKFQTDVTAGFTGSASTAISSDNAPTVTLGTTSTIEYTNLTATQTISSRTDYANLTCSGGFSTKTPNGNLGFIGGGSLTIQGSLAFDLNANQISFSGTGGTVTIDDIFRTSNPNGFRGSTLTSISSANSPTITLLAGSNIVYDATSGNQIISSGSYGGSVELSGAATKELAGNVLIAGGETFLLTATSGALDAQAFQISFTGTGGTATINGEFQTSRQQGFSGTTATSISSTNSPTITLGTNSTIVYYGNVLSHQISARTDYANVTLRGGPNVKSLAGTITLGAGRTLLVESDVQFSPGSANQIDFAGTGGTVNVQGAFIVTNLFGFAGTVSTTIEGLSFPPTITLGPTSIVRYLSSSAQEISPLSNYHEIELSGTGLKNISSGTVQVDGISLSAASGSLVLNGGDLIVDSTINSSAFGGVVIRPASTSSDVIIDAKGGDLTLQIEGGTRTMRSLDLTSESGLIEIVSTSGALNLTISAFLDLAGSNLEIDANTTLITPSVDTNLENYLGGAGSFSLSPVGTFRVGSVNGISTGTTSGSLRVSGTRTFTTNSLISYTRNGVQSSGNAITGLTGTSGCNVLVDEFTTVTLSASATMLSGRTFTVNGSLFTYDFTISGAGNFLLEDSGTLGIGAAAGLNTGASGNIQVTGTRTYNLGATVLFCRNGAQNMGNGISTTMNITVSDSTTATVNNNISIGTGLFFLTRGKLTILSANTVSGSGATFTLNSNGILEFQGGTAIQSGGQLNFTTRNLNNAGSKIIFNSASAQTFGTSFPSAIRKFRKEGAGTLSGEIGLTIADSAEFIGGSATFLNGTLTLNGVISGSGTLDADDRQSLTIGGTGTISNTLTTPSALLNFTMNRAGQTFVLSRNLPVGTATAGALTLSNGTVRVNSPDTLTIANAFSRTNGFINTTSGGGRVRFNDNAPLVLPVASFTSNHVFNLNLETIGSISLTGGDLVVENSLTLNFGNIANRFLVNSNTLTLNGSLTVTQGRLELSDGTLVIGGSGAFTFNPTWFDQERIRVLRLSRNGNVIASGTQPLLLRDLELNFASATNEFQIGGIPRLQFDFLTTFPTITKTQGLIDATSGTVQFLEGLTVPDNTFKNDVIFGCRSECNNADLTLQGAIRVTNDLLINHNFPTRQIIVNDSLILDGTLTYTLGSVTVGANRTLVNNGVASFPSGFFTSNQVGNFVINRAAGVVLNSNLTTLAGDTLSLQSGNLSIPSPSTLTVNGLMQTDGSTQLTSTGNFTLSSGATLATQHPSGVNGAIAVTGTRTFNPAANYIFNALANQNTGFPIGTCANVTFGGSGIKTLNANFTATAGLNINSGVELNTNGFVLTYGGSAPLFNAGIHSGAGQIRMTGSTSTNITGGGSFATLEVDKTSGNFAVLTTPLTLNNLIQTSGRLSLNGQTLTVNNSVTTTIQNDNPLSSFVCGNGTGTVNLSLSPVSTLRNLTVNRAGGFMTLGGNLTIENSLNLTNGSLALGGATLTLDNAVVTGTGLLRGSALSSLVFTGSNDVGEINFETGFRTLLSLTLSRTSADTLTLGTPLTATTVTLTGGARLVGGNNLTPNTLNYFGGLISPAPSTATTVQISPAANGQFLTLPLNITSDLSVQDGSVSVSIENDVITNNLDFGNQTLLNMVNPRTLTVTGNIFPDFTEPVPSRVNGRLRRPVSSSSRIWYIGDATRFRPVRMIATSGSGSATIRYVANDTLPPAAQAGLSGVSGRAVRYWDIDASGITADIAFKYDASDFPFTFNESAMQVYHWTGAFWERKTKDSQDLTNDTIRITGVSSFSPFLLTTTEDAPLPVSLTSFTGVSTNEGVKLAWETATEQDNLGFEIRRSCNGITEVLAHYRDTPALRGRGTTLEPTRYAYTDATAEQGKTYRYVLRSFDLNGTVHEYADKTIEVLIDKSLKPKTFALAQNFPNPFNPSTVIQYQLPESGNVKLELYDITGRKIATMVDAWHNAGYYSFNLDASAYNLSSGAYFYHLNAGTFVATKKMILVK